MSNKFVSGVLFSLIMVCTMGVAPRNEADLKVAGESKTDRYGDPNLIQLCKGTVPHSVDLASAGLTPQQLRDGVSCVTADFNGDGYLDFVLYGSKGKEEAVVGRNLLVIFFKGKNILKSQVIKKASEVVVFDAKSPARKNYDRGNPSLPGLIRPGEGDRGYVYFLNEKTGLFEEVSWIAPADYD